jgi:hypothetical protein
MPIKSISALPAPGYLIQVCARCGSQHRISLNRGAQKSRTGPVKLQPGDTLELRIDDGPPTKVTFAPGDFANLDQVTAAELAAKVQREIPGVIASDDAGGLLLESATTGPGSRIEITGGSARAALGFRTDDSVDPCHGAPVLGVSFGPDQMQDPNIIALRRCNDCGANECVARTFEAMPAELSGSYVAEHRRIVNTLAEHCKSCGWSHPDMAAHHAAEARKPVDIHAAFPERELELAQFLRPAPPAATAPTKVPR